MTNPVPAHLQPRFTTFPDEAAWLADRTARIAAGGIGSTTASALLGLSPWSTPWEVWARVHAPHLLSPDDGPPERILLRGLAMEPIIASLYERKTGALTHGTAIYMTATNPGGIITSSPDAIVVDGPHIGVGEWKFAAPWTRDEYPDGLLEVRSLADLDDHSTGGRWPAKRQYVVQCLVHLIATGLDFCDLYAVFGEDVECGMAVAGWDSDIAIHGTSRLRIWRNPEMLNTVGQAIMTAHDRIIVKGEEPTDGQPDIWGDRSDPLSGKRDATLAEIDLINVIAEAGADLERVTAMKDHHRRLLRDSIEASGRAGIRTETTDGRKVSATISRRGTLTIRGL